MPKTMIIFDFECIVRHCVKGKTVLQWIGLPTDPRAICVQRFNDRTATDADTAALEGVPVIDNETVENPPIVIL